MIRSANSSLLFLMYTQNMVSLFCDGRKEGTYSTETAHNCVLCHYNHNVPLLSKCASARYYSRRAALEKEACACWPAESACLDGTVLHYMMMMAL